MKRRESPAIAGLLAMFLVSGCVSTHTTAPVAQSASKQIPAAAQPPTAAPILLVSHQGDQKNGEDDESPAAAKSGMPSKFQFCTFGD